MDRVGLPGPAQLQHISQGFGALASIKEQSTQVVWRDLSRGQGLEQFLQELAPKSLLQIPNVCTE